MTARVEFGLLGPLTVRRDGAAVAIAQGKQRVLLVALLLRAGRSVPVEELAEALWGAAPPPSARPTIRNLVKRLRVALGDAGRISTQPGGYQISVRDGELDVARVEALAVAARAAEATRSWTVAAARAREALALWRDRPLADVESELLATRDVPRLAELRLQLAEIRAAAELELGWHAGLLPELRRLAAAYPLRERLHALLMTALHADGQRAQALEAYQDARRQLVAELGIEPGEGLRQVHQQILAGTLAPPGQAVPPPAPAVRFSLPPDSIAFTGRAAELAAIMAAVAGTPGPGSGAGGVVTIGAIGGMPGVGKTTLAVHAAHLLRDRFPDRQLFIDLRGHTPGQDPLPPEAALAELLGATGADPRNLPADLSGRAALWRDKLAGQRVLLVLDNAASSAQVGPLLPGGDGCLVLVTSRRQLAGLPDTAVPLLLETLPPDQAGDMFRRLAPRAAASPAAAVAELAELAGYLPLAISLLARVFSRHPAWSLADLAAETRARLLTLAAEDDSVAAALEVSWHYLDPGQRDFFGWLGLHPGPSIDAPAAAALAGVTLARATGLLEELHAEGLLTETGYRRYGLHDLIRRYAGDRAAAGPAAARQEAVGRLLDYYQHAAGLAEALLTRQTGTGPPPVAAPPVAVPPLASPDQALAWARTERPNLLACIDYAAATGEPARMAALTAGVSALLRRDGPWAEAISRHAAAAAAARDLGDQLAQARALGSLGIAMRLTGDNDGAAGVLREALAISRHLGDQPGQAGALNNLGIAARQGGDYPGAARLLREALSVARAAGDRLGQASALIGIGEVRRVNGDTAGAAQAVEEALAISRGLGDRFGQAAALIDLGSVQRLTGDYAGAAAALGEAVQIAGELGDRLVQANAFLQRGVVLRETGDYPAAIRDLDEAHAAYGDLQDRLGQVNTLINLGLVQQVTGDHAGADRALTEALGISRQLGDRLGEGNALICRGQGRRLRGDYPGAARDLGAALAIFRELGAPGAIAEVLNETGALRHAQGDTSGAADSHQQALDLSREMPSPWTEASALAGLARCAAADGDRAAAARGLRQALDIFERLGAAEATAIAAELAALPESAAQQP